ncbi:MAG TPA: ABC transporter substrate-binding protein [Rhodocyclaceae bacterium]|nr:ABC transporter substrate-binding protein [Rhodocyclaceae bacterium]
MTIIRFLLAISLLALLAPLAAQPTAHRQFVSLLTYRVGPYANNGIPALAGWIDYMNLVNLRGGINGVKLSWEECETEYNVARGVECYERLKSRSPTKGSMIHPISTGLAYALLDRSLADKVPMVTIGYGRTDTVDGRYFPYAFPLIATYQMQASAMLTFIAQREKGKTAADLEGKRIAFVYHDSAFGKEPLEVLRAEAALNRFDLLEIPVAHPGIEQTAQWQQVRQARPDYVIFWSWGAMNSAGLQAAQKVGFPRERIVGVWWAGAEEDTVPAGPGAKGYISANFGATGKDIPIVQDILKSLYKNGKGALPDPTKVGTALYTRGVIYGIVTIEAIRIAQLRFGKRIVSSEEIQWGLERLKIDQKRLKELGAEGMMPDLAVSCADHEGSGKTMFQQWDGVRWNKVSGYIEGNRKLVRQLLEASAKKYADERNLAPRNCAAIDAASAPAPKRKK